MKKLFTYMKTTESFEVIQTKNIQVELIIHQVQSYKITKLSFSLFESISNTKI